MKREKYVNEATIRYFCYRLCDIALKVIGGEVHREVWAPPYGEVLVSESGDTWIGDLCYMKAKFDWSQFEYMEAYGFNKPQGTYETDNLNVHSFNDGTKTKKFIMVISTGSDGLGPLDLGLDTAAVSFVSSDEGKINAAAEACAEFLKENYAYYKSKTKELVAA